MVIRRAAVRIRDLGTLPFGRRQATSLAMAGVLGMAALAGGARSAQATPLDRTTGVSRRAAITATAATPGAPEWDLPNLDHERVDYWVQRFTTDRREAFAGWLARSGRYVPMISQKLAERGMPQDLIYLTMIESGFNPSAYSPAQASGLWQFIPETGQRYGLRVDASVDERNDPEKSTDAALRYLQKLHDRFGSWYLAAAGYNTGENRVARIMREESGSERGDENSYYRIWHRLPSETRDYVPLMVAAARIAKEPAKYGFSEVALDTPLAFEEVPVDGGTPLTAIAEAARVPAAAVAALNPQILRGQTPSGERMLVRIPAGTRTAFLVSWPEVRGRRTLAATPYRVRSGDSLGAIAQQHGVSVAEIQRANALNGDRIIAGKTLHIPPPTR